MVEVFCPNCGTFTPLRSKSTRGHANDLLIATTFDMLFVCPECKTEYRIEVIFRATGRILTDATHATA